MDAKIISIDQSISINPHILILANLENYDKNYHRTSYGYVHANVLYIMLVLFI